MLIMCSCAHNLMFLISHSQHNCYINKIKGPAKNAIMHLEHIYLTNPFLLDCLSISIDSFG